jgi:Ca2+-binding RTX toxin-like protein
MEHRILHSNTIWTGDQPLLTTLRDLRFLPSETGLVLQAAGGPLPGFQITAWTLESGLSLHDSLLLPGPGRAGTEPVIETLATPDGAWMPVFLGDGTGVPVGLRLDETGGFDAPLAIAGSETGGALHRLVTVTEGEAVFAAGLATGHQSPALWQVAEDGRLTLLDPGSTAPGLTGLTDLTALGTHLVAGGTGEVPLSLYRVGAAGDLHLEAQLAAADNPGLAGDMVLASGSPGGVAHVVTGAAQSGSLSVWRIGDNGTLQLTDHLIDSRDSRFQGVSRLETVTQDGQTWIAAGGADSGVSLFRLLPSGRLVQVAQLADGLDWSLDGLAALALAVDDAGLLHLATAGLRDGGLSHFTYLPRPLLDGTAGNDRLTGTAQADLLQDGAGTDTLTGGAGADIFVFASDGQTDTVTDFDPSEDRLDLSGWAFFRRPAQLLVESREDGAEITFEGPGDPERLILRSASGAPLDPDALRAALLPGPDRLMPATLDAILADLPVDQRLDGTPQADRITGDAANDMILGLAGSDRLEGGDGEDSLLGGIGFDTLLGGAGDDTLRGLDGWDSLLGGADDDLLLGNNGNDTLLGGAGHDTLSGGVGADLLRGEDGNDSLAGSAGPDQLDGGTGADILQGNAGPDSLTGGAGDDRLEGGINNDSLEGGDGDDTLSGSNGQDILTGGAGADLLQGNAGPDALFGGAGDDRLEGGINRDRLDGGPGHDLLRGDDGFDTLTGGAGDDTLFGNAGNDWLEGGGGSDLLDGGIGADTFVFRGGDVRIARFQKNVDTILFDPALLDQGAASPQDLLSRIETVGEDLLFDFGPDGRLTILGLSEAAQIADAIGFL